MKEMYLTYVDWTCPKSPMSNLATVSGKPTGLLDMLIVSEFLGSFEIVQKGN